MQTNTPAAIASFLLAKAVKDLFPKIQLAGTFSERSCFSFDFLTEFEIDDAALQFINDRVRDLISSNIPLIHHEMLRDVAVSMFKSHGEWEIMHDLKRLEKNALVSLVRIDNLVVPGELHGEVRAKEAGAVKLLTVNQEKILIKGKPSFRFRLSGVAAEDQASLKVKVKALKAADDKAHEKHGADLELFEFIGKKPLFLAKGTAALRSIECFTAKAYESEGISIIRTPLSPSAAEEERLSWHVDYFLYCQKKGREYCGSGEIGLKERCIDPCQRRGLWYTDQFWADTAYFFVPSHLSVKTVISSLQFIEKNANISGVESRWLSLHSENLGVEKGDVSAEWVSLEALIQKETLSTNRSQGKKTVTKRFALFYQDARQELWEGPSIEVAPLPESLSMKIREESQERSAMVLVKATLCGSFERLIAFCLEKTGTLPLFP